MMACRLTLVVVLALGGALVLGAQAAFGCSCVAVPAKDKLAAADAAFVGTVIERRDARPRPAPGEPISSDDPVDVRFRVERAYKGELGDEVVVRTSALGASCGLEAEVGERIGLVVDREDARWEGGLCDQVDPEELAEAAGARAQWQPVASSQGSDQLVPVMDHFGGITVFNERRPGGFGPGSDRYFLTVLVNGQRQRLPVEPRLGVPFDIDLGPDGKGNVVAAYSRCEQEPHIVSVLERFGARVFSRPYPAYTAGRRCDIFRFDFSTMGQSKLAGASTNHASETLPSIWKDEVAFARVYEQRSGQRGRLPYLYIRPLADGRSERQPGGRRGTNGLPGPTRLDLYGRRLSFVWNYSTREATQGGFAGVSELRLDTFNAVGRDSNRVLSQARFSNTGQPYASFVGPQGADGRICYGYQRAEVKEGKDRSVVSLLFNYRIKTDDNSLHRDVPSFLIDTSTDSDENVIGTDDNDFSFFSNAGRIQHNPSVDYDD